MWKKSRADDAKENAIMLKTASMALITSFEGMAGWRQSWEDFKTSRNINAQIAHDIDLLENYFQLMRYSSDPRCSIEDAKIWCSEAERDLRTELGKKIFKSLHHEDAPDLKWWC
jgi:5'-deoxynucleotidase YfbR-like HD superfamily hydrolase